MANLTRVFLTVLVGLAKVNASPSLTANTKSDHDLKTRMLNDALDIVDLEEKVRRSPEFSPFTFLTRPVYQPNPARLRIIIGADAIACPPCSTLKR